MLKKKLNLVDFFPAWRWLKHYRQDAFQADLFSSFIVIAMLVPQGMAYSMLAGLPPVMGLYASVIPMIIYAFIGSSPTLSIGPVAIISMMTFATLNSFFEIGSEAYIQAACLLSLMVGIISLVLGILRFGFLIQLISHPVIKSFIIASAVLIALGQLKFILNIPLSANNLYEFIQSLITSMPEIHFASVLVGVISILFLIYVPRILNQQKVKQRFKQVAFISRTVPLILVLLSIAIVFLFNLQNIGIKTVGIVPLGFPPISIPFWNLDLVIKLLPGATMIAMISFVESLSIAQATALQQRSHLNSNQELIALGAANISAGLSSAFPVTGSLSRTVVNADAGAKTPMAGVFSSLFIVIISLYFTGFFQDLPLAVLAATIIVSIWKLVDFKPFIHTWNYSKTDGIAMWITFFGVICIDISTGLIIGVISTFILLLWRISRPHIAVIGLVEGTQHFRNIERYSVSTDPHILSIRIDENLSFLNAQTLKSFLINEVSKHMQLQHVIINCSSISTIDLSALEMLQDFDTELNKLAITLHLSEVKGPVMDNLKQSHWLTQMRGTIYLTHYQAIQQLSKPQNADHLS